MRSKCVCVCVCAHVREFVCVCVRERGLRGKCVCACVCLRKSENVFLIFPLWYGFELHVVHGLQCSVYHILMEVSLLLIFCQQ